jgi:hypothetical protein
MVSIVSADHLLFVLFSSEASGPKMVLSVLSDIAADCVLFKAVFHRHCHHARQIVAMSIGASSNSGARLT